MHFAATVTILYESSTPATRAFLALSAGQGVLTAAVGDTVTLHAPRGPERLEIIAYSTAD